MVRHGGEEGRKGSNADACETPGPSSKGDKKGLAMQRLLGATSPGSCPLSKPAAQPRFGVGSRWNLGYLVLRGLGRLHLANKRPITRGRAGRTFACFVSSTASGCWSGPCAHVRREACEPSTVEKIISTLALPPPPPSARPRFRYANENRDFGARLQFKVPRAPPWHNRTFACSLPPHRH